MLFYPIPIKLPLEAAGVIAIAVTTIFIFKAIQPEMHLGKAPLEEIRPPVVSEVPKPATPQEPVRKEAPEIGRDREAKQQSMKPEEQSAVRGEAEAPPPAPTPKPEPLRPMAELGAVKGERERHQGSLANPAGPGGPVQGRRSGAFDRIRSGSGPFHRPSRGTR